MVDMPRPRPPHLHHERTRHGVLVWYVRVGKGPRIRIKEAFGTPAFDQAYRAALAGDRPASPRSKTPAGTVRWLMERYRETDAWTRLSLATRRQRENIFRPMLEKIGGESFKAIDRNSMEASLRQRQDTPFQAKNFLAAMRGLFQWASEADHVKADPTEGLRVRKPKTDGFKVWSEEEAAKFEARWPIGTRERLAFDLALYTGLRRGDLAALGRQHIRDGIISIRTEKTNQWVDIPVLPELAASIAASPTGDLAFITGLGGKPMAKESFGNWFREICNQAGVSGSAHGLRKLGATRAANNGATERQLEAIFGWGAGSGMAALYTRAANRRRLAMEAMTLMAGPERRENVYSRTLLSGAGADGKKA